MHCSRTQHAMYANVMQINMHATGPAPKSKLGFIAARMSPMYPMYLLSITLLLINMVAMCHPGNVNSNPPFKPS